MASVGLKARLSTLEARLIPTNDLWWVVKIVDRSGDRNIHFVACGGEVYTKDANESAEELIQRVQITRQAEDTKFILASASTLDR